jgi:hypothetical protein
VHLLLPLLLLLLLLLLLKHDVLQKVVHLPVRQYIDHLLRLLILFTSLRLYCCLYTSCC